MAKRSDTTNIESTQGHVEDVEVQEKQPRRRGHSKDTLGSFEARLTRVEESTAEMVENMGSLEESMQVRLQGLEEEDAALGDAFKLCINQLKFDFQQELKTLGENFMGELHDMRAYYEDQLKIVCEQLKDALVELNICKKAIANGAASNSITQEKGPRQKVPRPHKDKSHNGENGGGEPPSPKKKKKKHVGKNSYANNKHDGQHNNKPKWQGNNSSYTSSSKPPRNCYVCDEPHWFKNCPKKQMANVVMAEFWALQRKKEKERECEEQQIGALQLLSSIQVQHGKPKKSKPRKQNEARTNTHAATGPNKKARRGRRGLGGGECHDSRNSQEVSTNAVAQQGKKPTHKEGQVCGTFRKNQEYSTRLAKICQQAKNILESSRMHYKALEKSAIF